MVTNEEGHRGPTRGLVASVNVAELAAGFTPGQFPTAVLNSLPAHIAVLNAAGRIVAVNEAWLEFAKNNHGRAVDRLAVGADYMLVCRAAGDDPFATAALHGIDQVLSGKQTSFELEYPCHAPWTQRWFLMTVTRSKELGGVVVAHTDISRAKRAEITLQEINQRYELVLAGAGAGIWDWDVVRHKVLFSPRWRDLRGLTEQDVSDSEDEWTYRIHPEDAPRVLAAIQAHFAGKTPVFAEEYRTRCKDGSWKWIADRGLARRDSAGQVIRMAGSETEITQRKVAEEKLRESEARYRSVLENMSEGVMVFDREQNLIYQNPASLRIHGFRGAAEGRIGRERLPVTWKAWDAAGRPMSFEEWPVARVFRHERFQEQVLRVVRVETGEEFHGSYNGAPILDEAGRLRLGFITIRDITQEVQARQALEHSQRRLRMFFDSEMMGAIYWNMDGQVTAANDRFLRMMGYTREDLERGAVNWSRMTPPEYAAADQRALAELRATGAQTPFEKEYIRKDGKRLPVLIGAAMLDEKRHEGVAFVLDITERKAAEAVLARGKQELENLVAERTAKLQELVGELEHFSYTITHDMKSPLRAMRGFAEIAGGICETGEVQEMLGRISTSADRMDALIRDALSYSRAVRQELPLDDVDVEALLRGMLDSYPELQPSRAHIRVDGPLPVVLGNEAGLTQCFSNLLGNAVKFAKPGQKSEVRVWGEKRGSWVRIWVEDQGIGISRDMLPRVFEMFSRGSRTHEGTGIGLALVRKVTQRMGGRTGVESELGQGSRFWVELKSGEVRQGALAAAPVRAEPREGTVLYVEDEESDALFMERAFATRKLDCALRLVGDGRAAIDYLSGAGKYQDRERYPVPSVVLLDLNLPGVTGFEVLKWMRNHPEYARTPAVVFSSSTREDDRVRAHELGATEFIAKPKSGLEFGGVVEALKERWL